jgi:hypothetical protein
MSGKNKRSNVSTPPRKTTNTDDMEEASSPIKSPEKKRVFTDEVGMDEDLPSPAESAAAQKNKERDQRRLAR